jgi:hypothetical protein
MSFLGVKRVLWFSALFLTASRLCLPIAIQATGANTVCAIGNCAAPGTLSPSDSISTTGYSFTYTFANTDAFLVAGTYSASGAAPTINFSATATFLGNATHTASGDDTLSVDLLQYFSYIGSPDGTYDESATLSQTNVAAGSFVTSQLSFGGQGIGLMGPFTGNGSQSYSGSANLTNLPNPSLADFNYTFHIAAGSPVIPEPAEAGLLAVGAVLTVLVVRRRRSVKDL